MNEDVSRSNNPAPAKRGKWKKWGRGRGSFSARGKNSTYSPSAGARSHVLNTTNMPNASCKYIELDNDSFDDNSFQLHWRNYISLTKYESDDFSRSKLKTAKDYLKSRQSNIESSDELFTYKKISISYNELVNSGLLKDQWPTFEKDLDDNADLVMGIFGLARYDLWANEVKIRGSLPIIRARLTDHTPITQMKHLRANMYEKLVTLSGTVIRVSAVRPLCTWLTFECCKCNSLISVEQPLGVFTQPRQCNSSKGKPCRSFYFSPLRSHEQTINVDWQLVRLQETLHIEKGRIPRTIECFLTADLCDSAIPGDVVSITGVLMTKVATDGKNGFNNSSSFTHSLYIRAISLMNKNNRDNGPSGGIVDLDHSMSKSTYDFTLLDYSTVQEIHALKSELFKILVASLCPSIYGHEEVKAGLLLGLFGGSVKFSKGTKNKVPVRGDPHILVVGDPGLGKSQMLSSCASVAPRGVLVTATGVTSSGLTVTLTRDRNEFSLEAGALVLADQGTCCIDEFDKLSGHYQSLLEAMEQQSISIAKSGITCTLPARTAILAAANPVGGHYNRAKTVSENLKLNPALLSRFDLVFIMIDTPNEESDMFLSDHIMKRHRKNLSIDSSMSSNTSRTGSISDQGKRTLSSRLRVTPHDESIDLIPHQLIKIYIAYARRYVFPKITTEAAASIKSFYLELRRNHHTVDSCPITTRQLESLIRLTEARARLELREHATKQDAEDVIDIVRSCLVDTFSDGLGTGNLDFSRAINGSGVSKKSKVKIFVSGMHKFAHQQKRNIFNSDEMKQLMARVGVEVDNFYDFMETLSQQGYFIKKSSGVYQLLSAEF